MVQEHCDPTPPYNTVRCPDVFRAVSYWRFLQAPGEFVETLPPEQAGPSRWRHATVLHTPRGDLYWAYDRDDGIERACPPLMGPRQWEELVLPYDCELMRLIKRRDPASLIHVHCHGKVGRLLPLFLAMGVDSTDPVEPPPQGDIEFGDARRLVGDRMTLYGNIELVDMERATPDAIEEKVRRAIADGGTERTVLYPSSAPHQQHTERFTANAVRYIEAGLRYGAC